MAKKKKKTAILKKPMPMPIQLNFIARIEHHHQKDQMHHVSRMKRFMCDDCLTGEQVNECKFDPPCMSSRFLHQVRTSTCEHQEVWEHDNYGELCYSCSNGESCPIKPSCNDARRSFHRCTQPDDY